MYGSFGQRSLGERLARLRGELLDRVGEVLAVDVVVAALHAQVVRAEEHVDVGVARGGSKR